MKRCQRCAEIEATPDEDMGLFFDPSKPLPSLEDRRAEGRRIKALAYVMHAGAGHPTEADYRRVPQPVTEVPAVTWPRPTLHGIGWLVQLLVGLATLYLIIRGGR